MSAQHPTIRVMTYNVHGCVGIDRDLSIDRIASVIATYRPDVVALQELDFKRARSGRVDQAHLIAEKLQMKFHFYPAIEIREEKYGDAILSRYPLRLRHAAALPTMPSPPGLERRGALWVTVKLESGELNVINTHMGLSSRERVAQARALVGPPWAGHPQCHRPTIICGDWNAVPGSRAYRLLTKRFYDVQRRPPLRPRLRTFPSRLPVMRIDHIVASYDLATHHVMVPRTELTRVASDHLPLIADLSLV